MKTTKKNTTHKKTKKATKTNLGLKIKKELFTLKNGLKVFIFKNVYNNGNKNNGKVKIILNVNAGSRNEIEEFYGMSHFLEHMLFRGNENYPTQNIIANTIYKLNGSINGSTSTDNTYYHLTLPSNKIKSGLDILSSMLFKSILNCKDILLEKKITAHERNKNLDDVNTHSYKLAISNNFKNTVYEHFINGNDANTDNFTRGHLLAFINANYVPSNISLCLSGDVGDINEIKKFIEKTFNKSETEMMCYYKPIADSEEDKIYEKYYKKLSEHNKNIMKQNDKQLAHKSKIFYNLNKNNSSSSIYIIYNIPLKVINKNKKHELFIEILKYMLGKGMHSILFNNMRIKEGLFYSVKTKYSTLNNNNNKLLLISYKTSKGYEKESIDKYFEIIKKLKEGILEGKYNNHINKIIDNNLKNNLFDTKKCIKCNINVSNLMYIIINLLSMKKSQWKKYLDENIKYPDTYTKKELELFLKDVLADKNISISVYGSKGTNSKIKTK